jgi:hypothetical protein
VNLGIVFDGLVIMLFGLLLLGIGLIWGLFALLLSSSFGAPIGFCIAGLVLIFVGLIDLVSGVRGWTRWIKKRASGEVVQETRPMIRERARNGEFLELGQRFGEVVSAVIMLAIFAFYVYHQVANTGFFTSSFGPWEMFAFYGSILLSLTPPVARAVIGRRNPVRPYEAAVNLFFAGVMLYLLGVFPFNFAHFTDALPAAVRFTLFWVTNDIAKIAIVLAFIGGIISAAVNIVKYLTFVPVEPRNYQRQNEHTIAG